MWSYTDSSNVVLDMIFNYKSLSEGLGTWGCACFLPRIRQRRCGGRFRFGKVFIFYTNIRSGN